FTEAACDHTSLIRRRGRCLPGFTPSLPRVGRNFLFRPDMITIGPSVLSVNDGEVVIIVSRPRALPCTGLSWWARRIPRGVLCVCHGLPQLPAEKVFFLRFVGLQFAGRLWFRFRFRFPREAVFQPRPDAGQ